MEPRTKLYLGIAQQRALISTDPQGKGAMFSKLILSTGMHPAVISRPGQYQLQFNQDYYSYKRPKSYAPVAGHWSRAMRNPRLLLQLQRSLSKSCRSYSDQLARHGVRAGLPQRLGALQLRHNYFKNRAVLGMHPFDIAHGAGTSLKTIMRHYTVGMGERQLLTDDDMTWLRWLMEV
jgi:hypothetical protein